MTVPENARSLVVFVHGSGSSRHSTRNRFVAEVLQRAGIATLLMDLLTPVEDETYTNRFDIDRLARRVGDVLAILRDEPETAALSIGLFGASTGAAAALAVAAGFPEVIRAVVSRGGRPDLAINCLGDVTAPVLLIVGGRDEPVIELNRKAYQRLNGRKEMVIIEGATHLFEEAGKLAEVASLARDWFSRYLPPVHPYPLKPTQHEV